MIVAYSDFFFFFFNDTATTEIYTLSLHDALPICPRRGQCAAPCRFRPGGTAHRQQRDAHCADANPAQRRSEEHTSELQSHLNLVCRLLLEKKKKTQTQTIDDRNKSKAEHIVYDRL